MVGGMVAVRRAKAREEGATAGVELRAGKRWCVARSHAPGPSAEGARERHAEQRAAHTPQRVVLTRSASLTPCGLLVRRHATDKTMTISSSCSSSATAVRACGAGRLVARTPEANASALPRVRPWPAEAPPAHGLHARCPPGRASISCTRDRSHPLCASTRSVLTPCLLCKQTHYTPSTLGMAPSPGQRTPLALFFPIASLCARVCVRRG